MSDHLVVDHLTVAFDSGGYVIKPLDGLSFTAVDGELVVLLGPSGCGKTTLLSCLAGLLTPTSGRIEFGSTVVTELRGPALSAYRRQTVGVVFQAFNLIPSLTARGNVVVPMRLAGVRRAKAKERADELLEARRARRARPPPAGSALGGPAAAGGDRPGTGARPTADPGRRAHRPPRPHPGRGHPAPHAGTSPAPAGSSSSPRTTTGSASLRTG